MKKLLVLALLLTGLAAPVQAVNLGANAGYLIDSEEVFVAAQIGTTLSSTPTANHIGEFEVGYTSISELGADADIIPLMLNYRAAFNSNATVGGYAGAGLGMSRVKLSLPVGSDSDWGFSAQVFAGVSFKVSEKASIELGARYLWIGEVELFGFSDELEDDISVEAGFRLKF